MRRQAPLFEMVQADNALGLGLAFAERGQKQARQNCDDRDDDQQLDQSESQFPSRIPGHNQDITGTFAPANAQLFTERLLL